MEKRAHSIPPSSINGECSKCSRRREEAELDLLQKLGELCVAFAVFRKLRRSDLFIETEMPISHFVFQRRGLNPPFAITPFSCAAEKQKKEKDRFSINRSLLAELKSLFQVRWTHAGSFGSPHVDGYVS